MGEAGAPRWVKDVERGQTSQTRKFPASSSYLRMLYLEPSETLDSGDLLRSFKGLSRDAGRTLHGLDLEVCSGWGACYFEQFHYY